MKKSTDTTIKEKPQTHYGVEAWRQTAPMTYIEQPTRSPEAREFFASIWPVADVYASSLNPQFLIDLPKICAENPRTDVLVRDGLLPLIWFYTKNPEPLGYLGTMRVHADFEEFVPEAWRPQTELYRFFSEEKDGYESSLSSSREVKELLLMGLMMPSVCSLSRLENDLRAIVKFVGGPKKIQSLRIRAFLPHRFEPGGTHGPLAYYNRYMLTICKYLGTNVEFMEFEALRWLYPEEGTWAYEFNERWLYADSFLTTLALSKRVRMVSLSKETQAERKKCDALHTVYPHVSCGIRKKFEKPFINYLSESWVPESKERAEIYFRAMNAHANHILPWPNWFEGWCKDLISERVLV